MSDDATTTATEKSTDDGRRAFLRALGTAAVAGGVAGRAGAAEGGSDGEESGRGGRDAEPVELTHGAASGDVTHDTAVVWGRAAEAATLHVGWAPADEGRPVRRDSVTVDESTDFTGQVRLRGLESGTRYRYHVWATAGDNPGRPDEETGATGTFVTAPAPDEGGDVTFAWSGDTYGYGDDPVEPPFEGLSSIAEMGPDFFLYLGDLIYADATTPAVPDAPSDSLSDYRAKYKEMRETNLADLLPETSTYVIWDDHEVINNFDGSVEPLMPTGRRALFEYWPIDRSERVTGDDPHRLYRSFQWGEHLELFVLDTRQYRDPNVESLDKTLLGREQMEWLKSGLVESDATWKVIATPAPMGHPSDTWATTADRTGYEAALVEVVDHVRSEDVRNVVSLAGDVHHSQVGAYDPDDDGEYELYEAIAGPLGAYSGTPDDLYPPLRPTEFFAKGDYYNYGTVSVSADGSELTFGIHAEDGSREFEKTVEARDTDRSPPDPPKRVESTFDDGTEGWLITRNGESDVPDHFDSGCIGDEEGEGGVAWAYQAPFEFLGDREAFYGGTLSFRLKQSQTDSQFDAKLLEGADVELVSGETRLVFDFGPASANPGEEWTEYEVSLSADADWINLTSQEPFATEDELRAVLADLERLRIRGEYRSGDDSSRLDDVVLERT